MTSGQTADSGLPDPQRLKSLNLNPPSQQTAWFHLCFISDVSSEPNQRPVALTVSRLWIVRPDTEAVAALDPGFSVSPQAANMSRRFYVQLKHGILWFVCFCAKTRDLWVKTTARSLEKAWKVVIVFPRLWVEFGGKKE